MREKEKLIEILNKKMKRRKGAALDSEIAEFLLANGVVQVVRCRDCAKRGTAECAMGNTGENDFCSRGIKKESEQQHG